MKMSVIYGQNKSQFFCLHYEIGPHMKKKSRKNGHFGQLYYNYRYVIYMYIMYKYLKSTISLIGKNLVIGPQQERRGQMSQFPVACSKRRLRGLEPHSNCI